MSKELAIKPLPSTATIRDMERLFGGLATYDRNVVNDVIENHMDYVKDDAGKIKTTNRWDSLRGVVCAKFEMLDVVRRFLKGEGIEFDEFNGLPPTRFNAYRAYELAAVWLWTELVVAIEKDHRVINKTFYDRYGKLLASVFKKYPKITGSLITVADLKLPGNQLLDYANMDDADFDNDHTDEFINDGKANEFKEWILKWCGEATERDKMRVRNWFQTKKSHRQIFAEIQKVVGNEWKFNSRLALFVERLFNQEGLEYFFEKTGFDTKEDMFMAYFDKLTQFDEETKKSFIKKYLLG